MPSSTFSSKEIHPGVPPQVRPEGMGAAAGIMWLSAGLVLLFLALEFSAPIILKHFSRIERRINEELQTARSLHRSDANGRPTVLLAGNSLLLEGVDIDTLRIALPEYKVDRLGIEQTHYLDWYFGLDRLFLEGSRPKVVVLSLASSQIASDFTLGEWFARREMSASDFPRAVKECNLDQTTASTYFFAHRSNWLGDKAEIRKRILILLVPNFRGLAGRIADHGAHINDRNVLVESAQRRLMELHDLGQQYGTQLVVLVPPSLREDYSREIQQVGETLNVQVWVPSPPGEFSRYLYSDGFHLNADGARIFTARLAQQIRALPTSQKTPDATSPANRSQ